LILGSGFAPTMRASIAFGATGVMNFALGIRIFFLGIGVL